MNTRIACFIVKFWDFDFIQNIVDCVICKHVNVGHDFDLANTLFLTEMPHLVLAWAPGTNEANQRRTQRGYKLTYPGMRMTNSSCVGD